MPHAIWTGSVSFGLVGVPVRMVSATRAQDVRFHQLEAETGARIRYRKVSEATGDEVANDDIVKGYEIAPGEYVTITQDDLDAFAPKSTRQIEIEDFVDLEDIDPIYFEQAYYLEPGKNGEKQYRLLHDTMTSLGKVAIGRVVIRSKEALVAIRPVDGVLVLETMRFADEILDADRTLLDDVDAPSAREIELASQLVQLLAGTFDPTKYRDEYRDSILELIERKAAGEKIVAPAPPDTGAKVLDLVSALEASLARNASTSDDEDGAEPAPKRARSRAQAKDADAEAPAKKAAPKRSRKSA